MLFKVILSESGFEGLDSDSKTIIDLFDSLLSKKSTPNKSQLLKVRNQLFTISRSIGEYEALHELGLTQVINTKWHMHFHRLKNQLERTRFPVNLDTVPFLVISESSPLHQIFDLNIEDILHSCTISATDPSGKEHHMILADSVAFKNSMSLVLLKGFARICCTVDPTQVHLPTFSKATLKPFIDIVGMSLQSRIMNRIKPSNANILLPDERSGITRGRGFPTAMLRILYDITGTEQPKSTNSEPDMFSILEEDCGSWVIEDAFMRRDFQLLFDLFGPEKFHIVTKIASLMEKTTDYDGIDLNFELLKFLHITLQNYDSSKHKALVTLHIVEKVISWTSKDSYSAQFVIMQLLTQAYKSSLIPSIKTKPKHKATDPKQPISIKLSTIEVLKYVAAIVGTKAMEELQIIMANSRV